MQKNILNVFFSNDLDVLAAVLQGQLFSLQHPFERRFVVVPDGKIKSYLYEYFAMRSEAKIAFGLEVVTLPEALYELTRRTKKQNPFYFPTLSDLSFRIEGLLNFYTTEECDTKKYDTLLKYIGHIDGSTRSLSRKKIIALSEQLALFYNNLGLQPQHVIDDWLKADGWQQFIWKTIFSLEEQWTYPERMLAKITPSQERIYLFGFSYIPSVYLDFFTKVSVVAYLLSPSEYFWEDLYSDKERVYLQKVLEGKQVRLKVRQQLDAYLRESNPLLGNWGRMGREFLKKIGSFEPYIQEHYTPPVGSSMLESLQKDFLYLAEDRMEDQSGMNDGSIEIHIATSVLREVEILYEKIQQLLSSQDGSHPLQPRDIAVFCPNIELYAPYIHQVFSLAEFPYKMLDVKRKHNPEILQAFSILLRITENRYDKNSIIELLSCRPFIDKIGIKLEDLSKIKSWIHGAGIKWGVDKKNKEAILAKSLGLFHKTEEYGSWSFGFERLLSGLIFAKSEDHLPDQFSYAWPKYGIEWNQSEILGKVVFFVSSLLEDIKKVEDLDRPFGQWVQIFSDISAKYFSSDYNDDFTWECKKILSSYKDMKGTFSLESFRRIVSVLEKKQTESLHSGQINAVTFSSLKTGAVVPTEVIYLLGMEEESYPRLDVPISICDLSFVKGRAYFPTRQEQDRYVFLECLLSARGKLIISYCRISSSDQQPQGACVLVEELLTYIEQRFSARHKHLCIVSHPPFAFHSSYFSKNSAFIPHTKYIQKAARAYYDKENNNLSPLLATLYGKKTPEAEQTSVEVIKIKDLARFAKHPLKFYMQSSLGIYPESLFERDDEFTLPFYAKARMSKEVLSVSAENIFSIAKAKGELPKGVFEEVSISRVQKEMDVITKYLATIGISKQEIRNIHFQSACRKEFEFEDNLILPAIHITTAKGRKFILEGVISDVADMGLLFHGEDSFKDLSAIWPIYLIFLTYHKKYNTEGSLLFALKDAAQCEFLIEDPKHLLGLYLDYFYESRSTPSFILPEWSECILLKNYESFQKLVQDKIHNTTFFDDYVRWIFFRDNPPTKEGFDLFKMRIPDALFEPIIQRKDRK